MKGGVNMRWKIRAAAVALMAGLLPGLAAAQAVDDIVGLRPGMTFEEVTALVEGRDDVTLVETAEQWIRQSHGIPTRQLLRGSNGVACAEGDQPGRLGGHVVCDTLRGRFEARKDVTNEIIVAFTGMPEAERAVIVWRRLLFEKGQTPTVASLAQALTQKYGDAHIQATDSGYYSMSHRPGTTALNWLYDPAGKPIVGNDTLSSRCVNGPKPWFAADHSWNGGCGLTVRAEIIPVPGNNLLALELNVSVLHQRDLLVALNQFDSDLKAAVEQQAQGAASEPDL
jgi:hypothetical protein